MADLEEKVKAQAAARKRPGAARKRRREQAALTSSKLAEDALDDFPAKRNSQKTNAPFGDLMSLANNTGLRKTMEARPSRPSTDRTGRAAARGPAARPLRSAPSNPLDVYRAATETKESREKAAREQAEEEARVDAAYKQQRLDEAQARREMAHRLESDPTVASLMRDAHELEKLERYLFRRGEPTETLDLKLKQPAVHAKATELWTIEIEQI